MNVLALKSVAIGLHLGLMIVSPVLAQPPAASQQTSIQKQDPPSQRPKPKRPRIRMVVPPNLSAVGDRGDQAAGRGDLCSPMGIPMLALIPTTNIGLTSSAYPTFWFYLPYDQVQDMTFELFDDNDKLLHKMNFHAPGQPGIIHIHLAKFPLKKQASYKWKLSNLCQRTSYPFVYGNVKRISFSKAQPSAPRERASFYSRHGLWHEALSEMAQLHLSHPEDAELLSDWSDFLLSKQVELGALIGKPLLKCCVLLDP